MTNHDRNGGTYEAHDDNDDPGENEPLLVTLDSPSSTEAQGPPPPAESKHNVLTDPRFRAALLASGLILLIGISMLVVGVTKHVTSCSVRPDQSEEIANLTTRLHATKASLNVCTRNSTRLGIDLDIERMRLGVCRENGERLAERVDKVEGALELCTNQKLVLEDELKDVKSKEEACARENAKLRRQVEDGVFIDFREFVGSLGTGGDSWVCSDTTRSWSHGYVSGRPPHPVVTIKTWTAELTDAEHSDIPLVFPPSASQDNSPSLSSTYLPSHSEITASPEVILPPGSPTRILRPGLLAQHPGDSTRAMFTTSDVSIYIIGYSVTSKNLSGGNGWWRITKVDRFGIKDGRIEFWALASKWYHSKALYDVQVWYIER